ncbi:MAG: class I SAM-dependent methyltransferase, partial [SAR202 cluster bacterium]|nr:class I SAM-dependent methyltransferase [SAR202 cluster bacterium]
MNELKDFFDIYNSIETYKLIYPDENVIRFLNSNFKHQKNNQNILDLGFGSGRHLKLLHELGFNGIGIDFSTVA